MKDGGPAFPFTPNPQPRSSDGTWCQDWDMGESGMTLRDYFAAKNIAAWTIALASRHNQAGYSDLDCCAEAVRLGNLQADMQLAMLAERAKEEP